jgi:hypothetical protein
MDDVKVITHEEWVTGGMPGNYLGPLWLKVVRRAFESQEIRAAFAETADDFDPPAEFEVMTGRRATKNERDYILRFARWVSENIWSGEGGAAALAAMRAETQRAIADTRESAKRYGRRLRAIADHNEPAAETMHRIRWELGE